MPNKKIVLTSESIAKYIVIDSAMLNRHGIVIDGALFHVQLRPSDDGSSSGIVVNKITV